MSYAAFWSNGKNKNVFTNKYKKSTELTGMLLNELYDPLE